MERPRVGGSDNTKQQQRCETLETNEFVANEFRSLTSCGQGLWIYAWRLIAAPGYRLSFISLLSVKLISQDNKGTIPLRQRMNHLNDEDESLCGLIPL